MLLHCTAALAGAPENKFVIMEEVLADTRFISVASKKVSAEDLGREMGDHLAGYRQKRNLWDAFKSLQAQVEDAEGKLSVMKAVGKAKALDDDLMSITNLYSSANLREKAIAMLRAMEAQVEEGSVSVEERPHIMEHLNERLNNAKKLNKPNVVEKVDRLLSLAAKAPAKPLPVTGLAEIYAMQKQIRDAEHLGKRQSKCWTDEEKERMASKPKVAEALAEAERAGRMWFEAEPTFRSRLDQALANMAKDHEEQRKKEEAEAWQRERDAEQQALEEKKQREAQRKEDEARKLQEKLEAKKAEASLKPQKEAPKRAAKAKAKGIKLNPEGLFVAPSEIRAKQEEEEEYKKYLEDQELAALAAEHAEEERKEAAAAKAAAAARKAAKKAETGEEESTPAEAKAVPKAVGKENEPATAPAAAEAPKKKAFVPRVVKEIENKWGTGPTAEEVAAISGFIEEPQGGVGPALEEALPAKETKAAPKEKKVAGPPPKKKEKAKFSKICAVDLGWDDKNPNKR